MVGKSLKKTLKNNLRGNRKLKRSLKFGVGRYEGIVKSAKFITTKTNKEAIEIAMYNPDTEMCSTFIITVDCYAGEMLIDSLLDILDFDDASPEDLVNLVVGFETERSGAFLNIKEFFHTDIEFDEVLEEEEYEDEDEDEDDLELEED